MNSLKKFWDIINKDYPEIIEKIIDYDEKEVTIKEVGESLFESNKLSVIFSWPPVLPVKEYSTTFNSEDGAFYIKLTLI